MFLPIIEKPGEVRRENHTDIQLKNFKAQTQIGRSVGGMLVRELATFGKYLAMEEKSILTREKYLRDVEKFLQWLEAREITKSLVLAYRDELATQYAPASVNSMLSALNCYLSFANMEHCRVRFLKQQREIFCSEEKELTSREYQRLLKAAEGDRRLCLLMQTICATGIRVSEHRFITVEAARQGMAVVRGKGKLRTVLIPRKLCSALLSYCNSKGIRGGSIFLTAGGKPLDRSRIWAMMNRLCQAARVSPKKVYPHNLRHLFARSYYAQEKDIVRLADILGHSSINTTRIYTRESGQVHRRQIEKMPLLFIT